VTFCRVHSVFSFARWSLVFAVALCLALATRAGGAVEDWPQWRGPRGDGSSRETNLPVHWSATENVAWRTSIPGVGHSSPIIVGDRVFVTTCLEENNERVLLCLGRTDGKVLWQREVLRSPLEQKNSLNSYASATPCSDGRHVWVSFYQQPRIELVCYDLDGNEVWRKSPGTFSSIHGFCSSPILYKDMVILNCDQDAPAYIVAFDRATGAERYRIDRPNRTRSYCAPTVFNVHGVSQLMLSGSKCVASYDADTGKPIWIIDGPTEQYVASLVMADGVVFMTGGFPEHHLMGIDPTGSGNITHSPKILWHKKLDARTVSYVPSPIASGHWFFLVSDDGQATCWEARSGNQLWKQRLSRHQSASGVLADGNVYFTADDGQTTVFKASATFEQVARNPLGEEVRASPAISRGQIFIRTLHHLYCIGRTGGRAS
jgi:hypothetical protein